MDTREMYYKRLASRRQAEEGERIIRDKKLGRVSPPRSTDEDELLREKASAMYNDAPFGNTILPVKLSRKPSEYIDGSVNENIEKTGQLSTYAKIDPAMDKRISALTNQFVARAASSRAWQPSKDLYALGQDAYLIEMGRMGLRSAHQKKRR